MPRLLLIVMVAVLASCKQAAVPPGQVEVVVDQATLERWRPETVFVGRLQAREDVVIRSKASGYLQDILFREGDTVTAGAVLFRIDPAPVQAEVRKAEASLRQAESARDLAIANARRGQDIFTKGAISASEMDKLQGAVRDAEASVAAATAQLEAARLNLAYTDIKAPVAGRLGASRVSVGDLVGPESGELVSLVGADTMRVEFQVTETVFLNALKQRRAYEARGETPPPLTLTLEQSNGERYPLEGVIDYVDNRVNESTATLTVRASIPNPEGLLVVGQYVRVHVSAPHEREVLVIPQAALQADQQGNFVLEVDAQNTVRRRNVTTGERLGEGVIISTGLEAGARVIVRGVQKVKSGQVVGVRDVPAQA